MCTATSTIESKVQEYLYLKKMIEDLTAEADQVADLIKAFMDDQDAETMISGNNIVTYKEVISSRCDTKELRKLLGDALDPYMKRVVSRRFQVK